MIAWLACVLLPAALWAAGRRMAGSGTPKPRFPADAVIGFFAPAGLLAWAARPFPEQLLGWALGVIAWGGAFLMRDPQVFVAFGLVGAVWCALLGLLSGRAAPSAELPAIRAAEPAPAPRHGPPSPGAAEAAGFALELRCPTCGAALAVPVYHRMVRCGFCAGEHVVVGGTDRLAVVIPDIVTSEQALKDTVVAHLRQRRYLEMYDRRVTPLVGGRAAGLDGEDLERPWAAPPPASPLVDAVEAQVAASADAWAAAIAPRVAVRSWRRFLGPNWHRLGTLYQAAFGRGADGEKRLEFAVTTIESAVPANAVQLPEMGKLSYLRALRPLLGSPESACPALAVQYGPEEIERRTQRLSQRSTELGIAPIARNATFVEEVVALVYRPWHIAEITLDADAFSLLVDGGAGRVEGEAPAGALETGPLPDQPAAPPSLAPSRCPECGADLPFAPDAVAILCRTCFRVVEMRGTRWSVIPYRREEPAAGARVVPFWRFPLRLRTADGALVTDLPHLTDGIDGTYDQIGDTPQVEETFFVPAFRTKVDKAGVRLYRRLWPEIQGRWRDLSQERFTSDRPPAKVVQPTLPAVEARAFARVYLALAFTQRDLARAHVDRVREAFLCAQLEGEPELVFLTVADELVAPFDGLFGRARLAAIAGLEGEPDASRA